MEQAIRNMLDNQTEVITKELAKAREQMEKMQASIHEMETAIRGDMAGEKIGLRDKANQAFQGVARLEVKVDLMDKRLGRIEVGNSRRYHIGYGLLIGAGLGGSQLWNFIKDHMKVVLAVSTGVLIVVTLILRDS